MSVIRAIVRASVRHFDGLTMKSESSGTTHAAIALVRQRWIAS